MRLSHGEMEVICQNDRRRYERSVGSRCSEAIDRPQNHAAVAVSRNRNKVKGLLSLLMSFEAMLDGIDQTLSSRRTD